MILGFDMSRVSTKSDLKIIDCGDAYVGTDRRKERRREQGHERVERLLKNFGLNRRLSTDRRSKNTSWFLTSRAASA